MALRPNNTINSGGLNLTEEGDMLANVANPKVLVRLEPKFKNELLEEIVKFPVNTCFYYKNPYECVKSPLKCVWCGDECMRSDNCKQLQGVPAVIHLDSPESGPIDGGTRLYLFGCFGSNIITDILGQVSISINEKKCKNMTWSDPPQNSSFKWSVECLTASVSSESVIPISLKIKDNHLDRITETVHSSSKFSYVKPTVSGIRPGYGPVSGGTTITVIGEHLTAGRKCHVTVANESCIILRRNETHIECRTSAFKGDKCTGPISVVIDDQTIKPAQRNSKEVTDKYEYKEDPIIRVLGTYTTIISGGLNLTVEGDMLANVANPKVLVRLEPKFKNKLLEENCYHDQSEEPMGKKMFCTVPPLKKFNTSNLEPPTQEKPVKTTVTFIMDGVLQQMLGVSASQLHYFPDPIFYASNDTPIIGDENEELHFMGHGLNIVLQPSDLHVIVNDTERCTVTKMSNSEFVCKMEKRSLSRLRKRDISNVLPVEVRTGYKTSPLGNIEIGVEKPSVDISIILTASSAVVIISALCMTVVYVMRRQVAVSANAALSEVPEERVLMQEVCVNVQSQDKETGEESPTRSECGIICYESFQQISEEIMERVHSEVQIIKRHSIQLLDIIGGGNFGRVFKGFLKMPDKKILVAVKTINFKSMDVKEEAEMLLKEGLIMNNFNHPHVLNLIGVSFEGNGIPIVVVPYMENKDLHSYLRDKINVTTVDILLSFGIQIAEAMEYLSNLKFVHRDLAARNCMLDSSLSVKVADFGLSCDVYEKQYCRYLSKKATPIRWMAPETFGKGRFSEFSDVWSFGVVLWELMTRGHTPYYEFPSHIVFYNVKRGKKLKMPENCSPVLYTVMLSCWEQKYRRRPRFRELVYELKTLKYNMSDDYLNITVPYVDCGDGDASSTGSTRTSLTSSIFESM